MSEKTAKIFMNGQSQAVRLPKEYRFDGKEVYIRKEGDEVILSEKVTTWDDFFESVSVFDDDYLQEREDVKPQERAFE